MKKMKLEKNYIHSDKLPSFNMRDYKKKPIF